MHLQLHRITLASALFLCLQSFNTTHHMLMTHGPSTEVKNALDSQVAAWNRGDLEKAMTYYWNSPRMLWISKAGIQKGYQPVLEGFRADFADTRKMGTYSYDSLYLEELSGTSVYFVIRWQIVLNERKLMGGISSQVWKKMDGAWVITSEHAG